MCIRDREDVAAYCATESVSPCDIAGLASHLKDDLGATLVNLLFGDSFGEDDMTQAYELSSCGVYDSTCGFAGLIEDFDAIGQVADAVVCETVDEAFGTPAPTVTPAPTRCDDARLVHKWVTCLDESDAYFSGVIFIFHSPVRVVKTRAGTLRLTSARRRSTAPTRTTTPSGSRTTSTTRTG